MRQLELCDDADFGAENVFEIPPELWTIKTKTKAAIENCMCAVCGKKPKTIDPLPAGWYWDSMEPGNNWVWCDEHNFDDA